MGKTGRPEENDAAPLLAMAEIVHINPEMNITSVIRLVIQSMTGFHSEEAIIKRLRRKFERDRAFLMSRVRSRKERSVVYLPQRSRTAGFDFSMLGMPIEMAGMGATSQQFSDIASQVHDSMHHVATKIFLPSMTLSLMAAAEHAASLDLLGLTKATEAAALLDTSAMVRAAERATSVDVLGLTKAAEAAALLDTSAMVRAAERATAGTWRLQL